MLSPMLQSSLSSPSQFLLVGSAIYSGTSSTQTQAFLWDSPGKGSPLSHLKYEVLLLIGKRYGGSLITALATTTPLQAGKDIRCSCRCLLLYSQCHLYSQSPLLRSLSTSCTSPSPSVRPSSLMSSLTPTSPRLLLILLSSKAILSFSSSSPSTAAMSSSHFLPPHCPSGTH